MQLFQSRDLLGFAPTGRVHFVTFVTRGRLILPDWARDIVLNCCLFNHQVQYELHGVVVMPDHVHLAFTPLMTRKDDEAATLASIVTAIKNASSHSINKRSGRRGNLWRSESFDHVLRSWEPVAGRIDYICHNPVRKSLCRTPDEYPWLWIQRTHTDS